jgi:FKBP-type peptidyl-prolyl cis-trans isomerase
MNRILLLILLAATACGPDKPTQKAVTGKNKSPEVQTSEMHREWIQEDIDAIEAYVSRRGWKMQETGTGTLYYIFQTADGEMGKVGDMATVGYTVSLLDGTVCYSSEETGDVAVRIEKDDVESGIHEVLQRMHVGEKAAVILHPHRAHGLLGDTDKIGPQSVVIYILELKGLRS